MSSSPTKRQKVEKNEVAVSKPESQPIQDTTSNKKAPSPTAENKNIEIPKYSSHWHFESELNMKMLIRSWNALDRNYPTLQYEGKEERLEYFKDLNGHSDYSNPFFFDDRESFSMRFRKLFGEEQKFFKSKCIQSLQRDKPIAEADINKYFSKRHFPLFVDENKQELKSSGDEEYRDGSQRYPFYSIKEAVVAQKEFDFTTEENYKELHIKCKPTCTKNKICPVPTCKTKLCLEHGNGYVTVRDEEDFVQSSSSKCYDCDTQFCAKHAKTRLIQCPTCERTWDIWNSIASECCVNYIDEQPREFNYLCKGKCGKECSAVDECSSDNSLNSANGDGSICGALCCKSCLTNNHFCFDDPRERL